MRPGVSVALVARWVYIGQALLAAVWCFLAYPSFTFHQIHRSGLLPVISAFARYHAWDVLGSAALLAFALRPYLRGGHRARVVAAAAIAAQSMMGLVELVRPRLDRLENSPAAIAYGCLMLLQVWWLLAADTAGTAITWSQSLDRRGDGRLWGTCLSASLVTALYMVLAGTRGEAAPTGISLMASLVSHLALFILVFLLLEWVEAVRTTLAFSARFEFWATIGIGAGLNTFYVYVVVTPAAGFEGPVAFGVALALGSTVAAAVASTSLCLAPERGETGGVEDALAGLAPGINRSRAAAVGLGCMGLMAFAATRKAAAMDWNGVLQTSVAALVWVGAFALSVRSTRPVARERSWVPAAVAAAVLAMFAWAGPDSVSHAATLETWASYDPSFALTGKLLRPAREDFYRFLAQHANVPSGVKVDPSNIRFVGNLRRTPARKPHIFILVIDSLRRDYLSPYNPAVTFTPSIARFAAKSTVFHNAFSRYGGTGLAEPSIWTGGPVFPRQYVLPYEPMNTVDQLVRAEQYRQLISPDEILETILPPDSARVNLDPPGTAMDFEFGKTLKALERELDRPVAGSAPVFVYTQPQNVHISVIQREGAQPVDAQDYAGFYAPYASRVRRLDAAFGQFIAYLEARGLYDESVIILTADHGDSLGEDGRWGHAFTIVPEVIQVPLLIHVPRSLVARPPAVERRLVFTTDVAPTLYALLGHSPEQPDALMGTPLFASGPGVLDARASGEYLISSSYAPVFGILSGAGTQLFVADAVNHRDALYQIDGCAHRQISLSGEVARSRRASLKQAIGDVFRLYRAAPG